MSIIEQAKAFAIEHHGDQKYGKQDELPYSFHLNQVAEVVKEFGNRYTTTDQQQSLIAAAWLHDVIEDTPITFEDVFQEFGRYIARVVFAVTNEEGKNRRERHAKTHPKLRAAGRDAMIVKLSDRIANIRHSVKHNHGILGMYKKEYAHFRQYLKVPGELKAMWAELDVLMRHKVEEPK